VLGVAAFLSLLALALHFPAAAWLKDEIESAVAQACEPCKFTVGEARFGLSPPRVLLSEVQLEQGDPRDSAVIAHARQVVIPVGLGMGGPWRIGLVRMSGLAVTVHEGDLSLPKRERPPREGSREDKPLAFECEGIEATSASFTYRKDSAAGAARIHLPNVVAEIGPFGSHGPWLTRPIEGKAEATLEESGRVDLVVSTDLSKEGPWVDVRLRLRGQRLKEMNAYFRPEEGVSLTGTLIDGMGKVSVRNTRAEGHVEARYEGLDLSFRPNRHRGSLSALLNNLGVAVKLNKGNSGEPRPERESAVVTSRHAKESVVSFILRTLKEAAIRVAT
jgi:hypothetical protein